MKISLHWLQLYLLVPLKINCYMHSWRGDRARRIYNGGAIVDLAAG
jgi:hypothetical protein